MGHIPFTHGSEFFYKRVFDDYLFIPYFTVEQDAGSTP
jgi:hypothetical protein